MGRLFTDRQLETGSRYWSVNLLPVSSVSTATNVTLSVLFCRMWAITTHDRTYSPLTRLFTDSYRHAITIFSLCVFRYVT